jgi:hypothetical protein
MHDDQLREQFTSWAQPLQAARPPALPVLRRRARRRIAGRATVAGLAVVGAVAVIAVSGFPRAGHAPAQTPTLGGVPRYAVALGRIAGGAGTVLDPATGKVLGTVPTPTPQSDFQWVAAAADDRTFVLAEQPRAATIRFYLLHLAANGRPGPLTRLDVPPLSDAQIYGMALTADASELAVSWLRFPASSFSGHISVTTLATGATHTWTSAHGVAASVSWAGDRTLAFGWQDNTDHMRSGVRLLDTAAPGSNPLASRLVIPASFRAGRLDALANPLITQDGSTVFATMASGTINPVTGSGTKSAVVRFSARTGKLEAVLTRPARSVSFCGILWTDPRGRHLLVQCGTTQASIDGGHRTPIHLHQLIPASPIGYANTFAW